LPRSPLEAASLDDRDIEARVLDCPGRAFDLLVVAEDGDEFQRFQSLADAVIEIRHLRFAGNRLAETAVSPEVRPLDRVQIRMPGAIPEPRWSFRGRNMLGHEPHQMDRAAPHVPLDHPARAVAIDRREAAMEEEC